MTDYVIIVAGGKGLRMGGDVPKQFLPVGGVPVLMRTLQRFHEYSADVRIILVLPREQQAYWQQLCADYAFSLPYLLADGGATRFHSVQNGLRLIPDDATGVVGVHDGVRPFVSTAVIARCYDEARRSGAVIPVVPVVESLRELSIGTIVTIDTIGTIGSSSTSVPRDRYRLVQTPQVFDIALLKAANRQEYRDTFTDDASVVESYGHAITLVEGNRENIKLTTPFDMRVASLLV